MEYDNTNSGTLFRNDKATHPKAPEYTGKIDVEGKEYQLAAWVRESKNGKKFFSIKVSEPYKKPNPQEVYEDTSDIPF